VAAEGQESSSAPAGRDEGTDGRPNRERRGRYGRERRERTEASEGQTSAAEGLGGPIASEVQASLPLAETAPAQTEITAEKAPVASTSSSPAKPALPKVQTYQLPIQDLLQVAQGSGLQWVNSDADKIAQVQAAIAAEPKPVHVPRERPPVVQIDQGPLILVETRRDLRNMELPFEASQPKG
jgi:ribonuclease E